jgi:hypothetical protein
MAVDKEETMIGSFGPQVAPHEVVLPRKGWDEAPKGLLARGKYKANSKARGSTNLANNTNLVH